MYGLPAELPSENELLASEMAIRLGGYGSTMPGRIAPGGVDLSSSVPLQHARTGVTLSACQAAGIVAAPHALMIAADGGGRTSMTKLTGVKQNWQRAC